MATGPPLRIAVCADSVVAQPTFEVLLRDGWVAGLCTTRASDSGKPLRHLAAAAGVPVYEVGRESLSGGLDRWLAALRPDLLLTCAFPYRLPRLVLAVPRLGAFNVHGGKLPEYRGPQPVFWQVANQEPEGAVTVHRMDDALDQGAVVAGMAVPIAPEDTYGLHMVRLAFASVRAVEQLLGGLLQYGADLPVLTQDESRARYHPRPTASELVIRWDTQTGEGIRALVKACNPWHPGAYTTIRGLEMRLVDVTLRPGAGDSGTAPGTILASSPSDGVIVNCRNGSALLVDVVSMDEGILPGKALATLGISAGERFVTSSEQ